MWVTDRHTDKVIHLGAPLLKSFVIFHITDIIWIHIPAWLAPTPPSLHPRTLSHHWGRWSLRWSSLAWSHLGNYLASQSSCYWTMSSDSIVSPGWKKAVKIWLNTWFRIYFGHKTNLVQETIGIKYHCKIIYLKLYCKKWFISSSWQQWYFYRWPCGSSIRS